MKARVIVIDKCSVTNETTKVRQGVMKHDEVPTAEDCRCFFGKAKISGQMEDGRTIDVATN